MKTLSVIVITYNEEHNIEECLRTISWANEIVVVDSHSTDATVVLANKFTDKVFLVEGKGYAAAKNFALEKTSGEWILWLDADERVTEELAKEIQAVLEQSSIVFNGFEIARRAYFLGKWIQHCGWYPGYVIRLFRKDSARFKELAVHEILEFSTPKVSRLRGNLLHFTDPNLFHYFQKFNKYTSLAAEELEKKNILFSLSDIIIRPLWMFFKMYFVKRGFMDGIQGFILCVCSSLYVFVKYAKLWERNEVRSKK
ncbi:MAG: glycosyltransferase family 2 protein [Ignavibacteriales bacterium]|nr:glycosyltransferase family 2 protein [Ignavibacteriales bacterium]